LLPALLLLGGTWLPAFPSHASTTGEWADETRGATVVYTLDTKVRNIEPRGEGLADVTTPIGKKLRKDGLIR
jgi:hypothetical protein